MLKKMCHSLWRWIWALDEEINMQERKQALLELIKDYGVAINNGCYESECGSFEAMLSCHEEEKRLLQEITQMIKEGV